jgi:hypothetical protein
MARVFDIAIPQRLPIGRAFDKLSELFWLTELLHGYKYIYNLVSKSTMWLSHLLQQGQ